MFMKHQYTKTVSKGNTILVIPAKKIFSDTSRMGYLQRIAELRKAIGMTQAQLAESISVEQPTIQRWERGKREPPLAKLVEIAEVLGVPPGSLLTGETPTAIGPNLFVRGEVAAGIWKDAYEWPEDDWQTFTGRADVTADMQHRFGLRVVGDSMSEVYPPGTIIECVSTMGHAEPAPGKRVVIIRENEGGEFEATVKELVEQEGRLWAVPRSSNPIHQPIALDEQKDGVVEARVAAVVVASVRPE